MRLKNSDNTLTPVLYRVYYRCDFLRVVGVIVYHLYSTNLSDDVHPALHTHKPAER